MSEQGDGHGRSRSHDLRVRPPYFSQRSCPFEGHGRSKSQDMTRNLTALTLWTGRAVVLPDLRAQDVVCHLIQDGVLDEDEEELILHEITTKARAQKLFDMILMKGDMASVSLGKALWRVSPHVIIALNDVSVSGSDADAFKRWKMKQEVTGDDTDGSMAVTKHAVLLDAVSAHLRQLYEHRLQYLTPLPWNDVFHVHIDHVYTTMRTVHVTTPEWATKDLRMLVGDSSQTTLVLPTDLFLPAGPAPASQPKHVLIEGEAGIGKSTLCQKLAYDWANPQVAHHSIKLFHLVFHLNADDFQDDIIDTICDSLLADCSTVNRESLRSLLADPRIQENVLFIIDGCDENVHQKHALQKLIVGKIYNYANILVTARPALCNVFLKYFDTACVILGFTQSQMVEFVSKYAKVMKCSSKFIDNLKTAVSDGHDLQDISRNPLQLWFLCLLCEERLEELPDTRTELYEMVTSLLINRGIIKYGLNLDKALEEIKVIHTLSCTAIQKGETFILDPVDVDHITILLQTGLIVKECGPSKLHPHGRFTFPHKTFQEFFAAKHLHTLSYKQRYAYLKHNRDRRWDMVIIFLCGLMARSDDAEIHVLFESVLQKDLTSAVNVVDNNSVSTELQHHSRHHLGLQCLAESGVFPGFENMEEKVVPPVYLHNGLTCTYCLKGYVIISGQLKKEHDFVINSLDVTSYMGTESPLMQALRNMEKCPVLAFINVGNQHVINQFLYQFLKSKLELSRLYIYLSPLIIGDAYQVLETDQLDGVASACTQVKLLPDLKTFVFLGCPSYETPGSERDAILSSQILDGMLENTCDLLTSLVLKDIKVTDVVFRRLMTVIQNTNLKCLILEYIRLSVTQMKVLASLLANGGSLRRLYLENITTANDHEELYDMIPVIESCPLQELQIRTQLLSVRVIAGVLSKSASKPIQILDLSHIPFSSQMWAAFIDGVVHLMRLEELTLKDTCMHNASLRNLALSLQSLVNLKKLDISNNEIGHMHDVSQALDILANHLNLTALNIQSCEIDDNNLNTLLHLLSNSSLEEIYMVGNPIGADDKQSNFLSNNMNCSDTLKVLHFTMCVLTPKYLDIIARNLSTSSIVNLWISCLPCPGLIGPDTFFTIHKTFRSSLPKLESFGFGISVDIDSAREPTQQLHSRWRALCALPE